MVRLAVIAAILSLSLAAHAASLDVVAGDRVLLDGQPAQLVGIDSPELCQPGGTQARQAFIALLDGDITFEPAGQTDDGVALIRLYVDRREVNQLLVQLGWAWDTTREALSRYAFAESVAKQERIGLWAAEDPVAPWEWKQTADADDTSGCEVYTLRPIDGPAPQLGGTREQPTAGGARLRG